jgi:N4-bis(aminopropyl)spermidine synthase
MPTAETFDCFYINPPWGQHNGGESVKIFMERGFEATGFAGQGLVVLADEDGLPWTQAVLETSQRFAIEQGHYVSKLEPHLHRYHQGRGVEPVSSNLFVKARNGNARRVESLRMPDQRLAPEATAEPLQRPQTLLEFGRGSLARNAALGRSCLL